MTRAVTTSIRLPIQLRDQLELASHSLHRGKNWIIIQALQAYLTKLDDHFLREEARRQSLLASKYTKEDIAWENNVDFRGWEE